MTTVLYTASQTVLNNGPLNNTAYFLISAAFVKIPAVLAQSMTQPYCHVTPSCAAAKYPL
ncbi:hypothetical protein BCR33DRAFT_713288, partial [Rhizoclosmatium globosum]